MKSSKKLKFTIVIFLIMTFLITFIYTLDKIIMPTVKLVADAQMRAEVTNTVNKTIFQEYSRNFNYNDIIKFEKDNDGNIIMMTADTLKLSEIATLTVLKAQEELEKKSQVDIRIPMGYVTKNNILARFGPDVKIRMRPIGHITTRYLSEFEDAGINQTRHKIYIETTTRVNIIMAVSSSELEIVNQIPIVETIIVGRVPSTAIQMDLNGN
ncbi:sporulation protein YunB [uncultured Clostridium sp.]|uniref:sporulation protein YunB n=1 Tax=uncultured Clostridium sp. TaxID=59620 RepID=UPI003217B3CB